MSAGGNSYYHDDIRRAAELKPKRFASRGEADFADQLMSAMRFEFGGHLEKTEPMGGNTS